MVLRSPSGLLARTPSASYDGLARLVSGNQGVQVSGPDYALRAEAFSLSLQDETFSFEGSVHTTLGAAP